MTLRHLKIFTAVYETLSFTKAGQLLFMAQPAVSLAIKELENYYGVILFDRIRHSIKPTPQGKQLYKYANKILLTIDEMDNSVKNWHFNQTIKIGCSMTIGNYILPYLISQFKEIYPDIQFQVMINNCETIENLIIQNQIDFALIESEPIFEDIKYIPFMKDHLCTIASPNHTLTEQKNIDISLLCHENILMREKGSSVRKLVDSIFMTNNIQIKPLWESASTQALINAVIQGMGITTLPYHLIAKRCQKEDIVQLDIPKLNISRNYNIVYYKDKYLAQPLLDFFKLCQDVEKEL